MRFAVIHLQLEMADRVVQAGPVGPACGQGCRGTTRPRPRWRGPALVGR
jgi:hypothetical protein